MVAESNSTPSAAASGGADEDVSQTNEASCDAVDKTLTSNDEHDKNHQQDKRGSTVSTGSEVAHDSDAAASAPDSNAGDGEPATDTAPAADTAQAKQEEAERRGSQFLLIAAQAAEAAEFAEKAQSRADAIRQAAIQLTSASPTQDQQNQDQGDVKDRLNSLADGIMNYQGQNSAAVSNDVPSINIDEQLKAQVYSVAATMMQADSNQLKFNPVPGLSNDRQAKPRPTPIKHVYHDYASAPTPIDMPRKKTGGVSQPFPDKLMGMLDRETAARPDVVAWCPHGRAFVVKKPKVFTAEVMVNYFRQSKLTSFQRQLNLYGFRRITQGVDAGAYYHELFLRGRPDLTFKMVRQKVKGTGHKQPTDASTEPNFYSMPPVTQMNNIMDSSQGPVYPHSDAMDYASSKPPPMAVPDGTLYTDSSKKAPLPSPSLQAVAALRRLSNPALGVPSNFSLGAPAAQGAQSYQQTDNNNAIWSDSQPGQYHYQMQPVDPSLSPSKVHGFHPTSSLGSCPVASEAAATMAQMFSTPGPAEGSDNGGADSMNIKSYPV